MVYITLHKNFIEYFFKRKVIYGYCSLHVITNPFRLNQKYIYHRTKTGLKQSKVCTLDYFEPTGIMICHLYVARRGFILRCALARFTSQRSDSTHLFFNDALSRAQRPQTLHTFERTCKKVINLQRRALFFFFPKRAESPVNCLTIRSQHVCATHVRGGMSGLRNVFYVWTHGCFSFTQ